MISNQETFNLSPYMAIYDIVVPKDNMFRQINELDVSLLDMLIGKTVEIAIEKNNEGLCF